MSVGVGEIACERLRQIKVKGYTPEKDDDYTEGELVQAALAYATGDKSLWPKRWVISTFGWKPGDDIAIRQLPTAGCRE